MLAVAGITGIVVLLATTIGRPQCAPSDFPVPSSSTLNGFRVFERAGGISCDTTWESAQDVSSATTFYEERLNGGAWRITATDTERGTISFRRISGREITGQLLLLGHGEKSTITAHFATSTKSFSP